MLAMKYPMSNNNVVGELNEQATCSNSCGVTNSNSSRPKRDFRFQVIEFTQGPKWFVWPSKNKSQKNNMNSSRKNDAMSECEKNNNISCDNSKNVFDTITNQSKNGKKLNFAADVTCKTVLVGAHPDDASPVVNAPQIISCPTSEPTTRRLSTMQHKVYAERTATSVPSSTFKILSVMKKWNDYDDDDDNDDDEYTMVNCRGIINTQHGSLQIISPINRSEVH